MGSVTERAYSVDEFIDNDIINKAISIEDSKYTIMIYLKDKETFNELLKNIEFEEIEYEERTIKNLQGSSQKEIDDFIDGIAEKRKVNLILEHEPVYKNIKIVISSTNLTEEKPIYVCSAAASLY